MGKITGALILSVAGLACMAFTFLPHNAKKNTLSEPWQTQLQTDLERIDAEFPGELGVYVKRINDGREVHYDTARPWYLASTIKVFVAACLLKEVEQGRIRLNEKIKLRSSDFVDGSGEVNWKKPGAVMSVAYLLEQMLTLSDSTATDMLIRRIGAAKFNRFVNAEVPGIATITTILDVRYGAYGEAHPLAQKLTNLDFISFKKVPSARRLQAFGRKIRVAPHHLRVASMDEAFERYYERGLNSGSLVQFGLFIERLLTGKVLNSQYTAMMAGYMERAKTGKGRIQAALPSGYRFAQKTGTQIGRMCNVGMITPPTGSPVVVTACLKNPKGHDDGEAVFRKVGAALARSGAWPGLKLAEL